MRTFLPTFLVIAALAAAAAAPAPAGPAPKPRRLTDAQLLRYAASPFDKRKRMFTREIVGLHRGIPVVADYPCGDVCPAYTRRIVRYDLPLETCAARGGIVASERIVRGIGVATIQVCEPAVVARTAARP